MGKNKFLLLMTLSVLLNLIGFAIVLHSYNSVFATNDDYRMRSIATGAYTGVPNPDLVFMKYPVGWLLSTLYSLFPSAPWYGLFTMLCIFLPSCVILYFILSRSHSRLQLSISLFTYTLLFIFILQKNIVLPQFTLNAAFPAAGTLPVLYFFNPKASRLSILLNSILVSLLCGLSVCVRVNVFLLFLPILLAILLWDLFGYRKNYKKVLCVVLSTIVFCTGLLLIDRFALNTTQYKDYTVFNHDRSLIYDYYGLPDYNLNEAFYNSIGIDYTVCSAISQRYLDIDPMITTQTYEAIINFQKKIFASTPVPQRLFQAIKDTPGAFFYNYSSVVFFESYFAFLLLMIALVFSVIFKRHRDEFLLICMAGLAFIEIAYLLFEGRMMDRVVECIDVYISFVSVICLYQLGSISQILKVLERRIQPGILRIVRNIAVYACSLAVIISFVISNQQAITDRSQIFNNLTQRLVLINTYADSHPNSFIFYDAYDFIGATSSVLSYQDTKVLHTESLGNWNVNSPTYIERNKKLGFTSSANALLHHSDVYFAAISPLKDGIKLLLERKYNSTLIRCDSIIGAGYTINIYEVVKK